MGLDCSGVYQQSFTFWSVTLQPLGAYRSTIPHMVGNIHSFHMRYTSMICYKRLQSNGLYTSLSACPLVRNVRFWKMNLELRCWAHMAIFIVSCENFTAMTLFMARDPTHNREKKVKWESFNITFYHSSLSSVRVPVSKASKGDIPK